MEPREAKWRIGYALLDQSARVVLDRPEEPLVEPFGLEGEDTDIAFAASAVVDGPKSAWLYYSIADRKPFRINVSVEGSAELRTEGDVDTTGD